MDIQKTIAPNYSELHRSEIDIIQCPHVSFSNYLANTQSETNQTTKQAVVELSVAWIDVMIAEEHQNEHRSNGIRSHGKANYDSVLRRDSHKLAESFYL